MKHNVIFAVVLAAISFGSKAASFDCAKAGTKYEHYICDNESISYLDEQLTAAYKDAVKVDPNQKMYQREWNKNVRNVSIDRLSLADVERAYHYRIAALRKVSAPEPVEEVKEEPKAAVAVPEPVEFKTEEEQRKERAQQIVDSVREDFLKVIDTNPDEKLNLITVEDLDIIGMFTPEERKAIISGFAKANKYLIKFNAEKSIVYLQVECVKAKYTCDALVDAARMMPDSFLISLASGTNFLEEQKVASIKTKRRLMKKVRERFGHTKETIQYGTSFDSEDIKDFLIDEINK